MTIFVTSEKIQNYMSIKLKDAVLSLMLPSDIVHYQKGLFVDLKSGEHQSLQANSKDVCRS